ncbi:DUF6261 family protein [Parabacteroides johnsonii]|uniref:DUF6261 family protein n=1 Tax=Parabacteroides johnsonii TaxID=387661 RepID=UPI0011DE4DFF|nr:DUF6261 family protein [Parabacteroides johnsonii]MBP3640625.1 hypothetical protein [Parabacteroides sp.]
MKKINSKFTFSRVRNVEHFQFHSDMLRIVSEKFADEQGVAPQRAAYKQLVDIENKCYQRKRANKEAVVLELADRKRDELFLYTVQAITSGKLCPVETKRQAAFELDCLLDPYRNATHLNYNSDTAAISCFVETIRKPEYAAFVKALDLDGILFSLEAANDEFKAVYTGHLAERLSRITSETVKTIRPCVDTAYREMASAINALYLVNFMVARNNFKATAIGRVIDQANDLVIRLQQASSKAGGAAKLDLK